MGKSSSKYIVGIDLGTTNCVLAYCLKSNAQTRQVRLLGIEQLVSAGEVQALPLLPSVRYQPMAGELAAQDLSLPWQTGDAMQAVFGRYARQLGMQVPGRLVSSAKSWLSHPAVDRSAPILPWGAQDEALEKISPLAASSSYLAYLRAAWLQQYPQAPLEQQELVLTVPASFDEGARALTVEAARMAGLPNLRLLEEPQAAFYDWLYRHHGKLDQALRGSRLILVVDVGGGTTDFSLIAVKHQPEQTGQPGPELRRIGVGKHLMLGGDNMDLALAHLVEQRMFGAQAHSALSSSRLAQLMERCRAAKEVLLAEDAPASSKLTLLGGGGKLIGGSRSVDLLQADMQNCIVDGFFPHCEKNATPKRSTSAVQALGLPYAFDAAITRHLASFLQQHASAMRHALELPGDAPVMPDTLLLNGGVFRAQALVQRLCEVLQAWRGAPLQLLRNENPDVAVARGAVGFALAGEGRAAKIGGGSARSFFILVDQGKAATPQALCILPRGTEVGQEQIIAERFFALRLGQAVRFHLLSTSIQAQPASLGQLLDVNDEQDFLALPALATVLQAPAEWANRPGKQEITVRLACTISELGTLVLECVTPDGAHRWQLDFQLRQAVNSALEAQQDAPQHAQENLSLLPANFAAALEKIERIFGSKAQQIQSKEVKQLRGQLEQLLGAREQWNSTLLRALFDALWQRQKARRRSVEHEKQWLNLIGYCLRPGFGDALDSWRMQQLWPLFEQGAQYKQDSQVRSQWWTLWRRIAGGLSAQQQLRLLDDFALNLQGSAEDLRQAPASTVPGSYQDILRLGAALEHIPPAYKAEIGNWILQQIAKQQDKGQTDILLWALARIGARQPFYGGWEQVVSLEVVQDWISALLAMDWRKHEAAAFACTHLARMTGERSRDIEAGLRTQVVARLSACNAPATWRQMVEAVVQLDAQAQQRLIGESLPVGLKLL